MTFPTIDAAKRAQAAFHETWGGEGYRYSFASCPRGITVSVFSERGTFLGLV